MTTTFVRTLGAIARLDLRRYAPGVLLYGAMAIGMPLFFALTGSGHGTVFQMLVAFAIGTCAVMTPFWFVTMDRIRGGMLVLWRLPIARRSIVSAKTAESLAINTAILLAATAAAAIWGPLTPAEVRELLGYGVPLGWILTVVAVTAYFTLNPQVSVFAVLVVAVGISVGFSALLSSIGAISQPLAYAFAYALGSGAVVMGVIVLGEVLSSVNDPA